jgi:hypothetical protein
MLDKFIINIKNIIFFKAVIYLLLIGFLLWLMPMLKKDYNESIELKQNAEKSFSEAAIKLYSIIESEGKILDTYRTYEGILNTPPEHICIFRGTIMNKIKALALGYNIELANVTFSQVFKDSEQGIPGGVKIKNYNVGTKFTTPNIIAFQNMIKEIYEMMPEYSIVTLAQVENDEFLDPKLIGQLAPTNKPNLLRAQLNVRVRELSIK